jgi:hypothetical protein
MVLEIALGLINSSMVRKMIIWSYHKAVYRLDISRNGCSMSMRFHRLNYFILLQQL